MAFVTSNELIILPCNCLNKDVKIEVNDRAINEKDKEVAEVSEISEAEEMDLIPNNSENEF